MLSSLVRRTLIVLSCSVFLGLAACETNPATGDSSFTAFMSPTDEIKVGAEQHPQLLKTFGGAYDDAELGAYVAAIGGRLAAVSHRPDIAYTFTVLDSPVVNALALPGGYVYVSRGLMALANSEAELAGVIGHEIGHVTARHSAERYSRAVLSQIGAGLIGIAGAAAGIPEVGDVASMGAGLYIRGYSRDQEFQADTLGLQYMTAGGYRPGAVADFLASLRAETALQAEIRGSSADPDAFNLLATHPRTIDRVREAQRATGTLDGGVENRDAYLRRLDGLLYGDSPEQGFVRDRDFIHPVLKFAFTAPPGFVLQNSPTKVVGRSRNNAFMEFSGARDTTGASMTQYLSRVWLSKLRLSNVEGFRIDGLEAATATAQLRTKSGIFAFRFVAIRARGPQIYRFLFATPNTASAAFDADAKASTYSFRLLSDEDAARYRPYRIRIVTVREGDTIDGLARQMPPGPEARARFMVLNGLRDGARLTPGQLVKVVSE
jgi:predicted Zn-dependent protease